MQRTLLEKADKAITEIFKDERKIFNFENFFKKSLPVLKVFLIFFLIFAFCFFITLADYANKDMGGFTSSGLFEIKTLGSTLTVSLFGSSFSFELPEIIVNLINLF